MNHFPPFEHGAPADTETTPTTILKWPDGKETVFMLEFDDSVPSALDVAIPELARRGMVGTFYINPGDDRFKSRQREWESEVLKTGMVYANHTFSHVGATSPEQLDEELRRCHEVIEACFPQAKKPRLVSFGQPGGVPWTVTPEEKHAAFAKYHLIERPPFKGYPFNIKTEAEVLALVDHALATGEMEHHVFHGVGADCHPTPTAIFLALLEKLNDNKGRIWITDPVSWHQYTTERETAAVQTLETGPERVRVRLTCQADPALYDLPLTLATPVLSSWETCTVSQGARRMDVLAFHGTVRYQAVPGAGEVSIRPQAN